MYQITAPCAYIQDDRVTVHKKAGAVVELPEDLAAELGECVRFLDRTADPVDEEVVVPLADHVGSSMGGSTVLVETCPPPADPEPVAEAEESPRGRRSKGTDG